MWPGRGCWCCLTLCQLFITSLCQVTPLSFSLIPHSHSHSLTLTLTLILTHTLILSLTHPHTYTNALTPTRLNTPGQQQVKYFKGAFQDPVNFFQMPLINAVSRELSRTYVKAAAANTAAAAAGGGLVEDSRSSSIPPLALAASLVNGSSSSTAFDWAPRMVRFPHPSLQTVNLLGQVLSSFIFASLMFGCVSQVRGG